MLIPPPADRPRTSDCDAIRAQTFAACDGEVSVDDLRSIDEHLAGCAACRHRFAGDATFHGVVRAAVSCDVAPRSLRDRILLSLTTRTTVNAPA
jgi:mycothiol system anti-sigma-R factor